jgi:hypothetical protein
VGRRFSVAVRRAQVLLKRQRSPVVRGEVSAVFKWFLTCRGQSWRSFHGIYPDDVTKWCGIVEMPAVERREVLLWCFRTGADVSPLQGRALSLSTGQATNRLCIYQKTESMVTPVFATPILTTSWLA